jgi:hypothetical protein
VTAGVTVDMPGGAGVGRLPFHFTFIMRLPGGSAGLLFKES